MHDSIGTTKVLKLGCTNIGIDTGVAAQDWADTMRRRQKAAVGESREHIAAIDQDVTGLHRYADPLAIQSLHLEATATFDCGRSVKKPRSVCAPSPSWPSLGCIGG